jgi:hypothetical protein
MTTGMDLCFIHNVPHRSLVYLRQPAILQVQCFPDAFQRAFPNHEVAEAAWVAFMRDGTFPDYGRSPWVVYFGRRLGVFTRV